ncbi:nucleotide pyrophosphohydrolase [Candidatus Woesearchaeota archaeon]|nr:nucleotide pyrophosphohydrolase [Candidatus Woesearchaeota archaeon]
MHDFDYLLELIQKSVELDPWIIEKGLEGYGKEVVDEAEEIVEANLKRDNENLKEELGDVLSEVIIMCKLAEKRGIFEMKDVIRSAIEKIKRRRPYVLTGKKVSMDEAVKLWYDAKAKEKENRKKR